MQAQYLFGTVELGESGQASVLLQNDSDVDVVRSCALPDLSMLVVVGEADAARRKRMGCAKSS